MTDKAQRHTTSGGSLIGRPVDRVDGPVKVTGTATYAYEVAEGPPSAFGFVLGAGIAKGRILEIETGLGCRFRRVTS
ncbi:hypothetical protein [Sinorhizobium meliloti]|nr:hypothetical protein [Sinorhizobium meliloti]